MWTIGDYHPAMDRQSFDCGKAELNDWLMHRATQFQSRNLCRIYVAARPGDSKVLGFYAVAAHAVEYAPLTESQSKGLPRISVPVVLLGQLAVDRSVQDQGLGKALLIDALVRAGNLSKQIGIRAVEVVALDEAARRFYTHFGFESLQDDKRHLFLPISVARKIAEAAGPRP